MGECERTTVTLANHYTRRVLLLMIWTTNNNIDKLSTKIEQMIRQQVSIKMGATRYTSTARQECVTLMAMTFHLPPKTHSAYKKAVVAPFTCTVGDCMFGIRLQSIVVFCILRAQPSSRHKSNIVATSDD